jgi:hypothetical protein
MADWIKEGCAERSAARIAPVRHLLKYDNSTWRLWCSGGRGHPQTAVLGNDRFCSECLALANESIEDETLDPSDVSPWPVKVAAT